MPCLAIPDDRGGGCFGKMDRGRPNPRDSRQRDRPGSVVHEHSKAASRLSELKRDGQKLAAQLGSLRKAAAAAWFLPERFVT